SRPCSRYSADKRSQSPSLTLRIVRLSHDTRGHNLTFAAPNRPRRGTRSTPAVKSARASPKHYGLTGMQHERYLALILKILINRNSGSRTRRKSVVVKHENSSQNHSRIDKLATIQYRFIDIDIYVRKGKSITFHSFKAVGNVALSV